LRFFVSGEISSDIGLGGSITLLFGFSTEPEMVKFGRKIGFIGHILLLQVS
jgi:hypothetical protein